jgi:hypothetical protein
MLCLIDSTHGDGGDGDGHGHGDDDVCNSTSIPPVFRLIICRHNHGDSNGDSVVVTVVLPPSHPCPVLSMASSGLQQCDTSVTAV